jgi:hypothetical protein
VDYLQLLVIFTVFPALLGLGKIAALAAVWNISETEPSLQLHRVQILAKGDSPRRIASLARTFKTSKGTLKPGSVLSVDPDEVRGIPKSEARSRFILNKIYRVQEGTTADDLFIVDGKANKWGVENVSEVQRADSLGSTVDS